MAGIDISSIVTVTALIAASFLIAYLTAQHTLRQARENSREQLELRMAGLSHAIAELEQRVAELARSVEALRPASARNPTAIARIPRDNVLTNSVVAPAPDPPREIAPETLAMIAAAVTAYLGKPVRIRSARMLQSPYEIVNPWAQQGRVIVQASHNQQVRHR